MITAKIAKERKATPTASTSLETSASATSTPIATATSLALITPTLLEKIPDLDKFIRDRNDLRRFVS